MCVSFRLQDKHGVRDVFPGDEVEVCAAGRSLDALWGVKRAFGKGLIINARSETAPSLFKQPFESGRCVISADGFYEWSPQKQKFYYTREGGGVLLCGFFREETEYAKSVREAQLDFFSELNIPRETALDRSALPRFVLLTTSANESVIAAHRRMPLIIDEDKADSWLLDDDFAKYYLREKMPPLVHSLA